jgi:hypothetical protein
VAFPSIVPATNGVEAARRAYCQCAPRDAPKCIRARLGNCKYKASVQTTMWTGKVVAEIHRMDPVRECDQMKAMSIGNSWYLKRL